MSDKLKNIECSVVVCTYKPIWEKLRLTLKSILMQEDCNFRIVVTDDGSEENYFTKIKDYLDKHGFYNYELIASPQNHGTVRNIKQGMNACEGDYVKMISPGDFLHGKAVLRKWIDFMNKHNDCIMSFCDAIYYHIENGNIIATKEYAHPQWADVFKEGTPVLEYIIYGDTCSGAATMLRRDDWIRYLDMMVDKVIYTEDVAYRIMLSCGEKIAHIPEKFLLYEYGTGISTNGSEKWAERISRDFIASDDIILSSNICDDAKCLRIDEYLKIPKNREWKNRLKRVKFSPSHLLYYIKTKIFPKTTPVEMDSDFVQQLMAPN